MTILDQTGKSDANRDRVRRHSDVNASCPSEPGLTASRRCQFEQPSVTKNSSACPGWQLNSWISSSSGSDGSGVDDAQK